jgi:hypothetical protein
MAAVFTGTLKQTLERRDEVRSMSPSVMAASAWRADASTRMAASLTNMSGDDSAPRGDVSETDKARTASAEYVSMIMSM